MTSAIFFLDSQGNPLLSRNYRGDIPMSTVENFPQLLINAEESGTLAPCITHEGINYMYITYNNIYLLALSKKNSNAASTLLFLNHIIKVLTDYLKHVEEESIRDNFVIIYELLDEMMDFGHPQITDTKVLQEYITQESYALDKAKASEVLTKAISWRPEGLYYKKNEFYLDVVESLNVLMSHDGKVLQSDIVGKVNCNAYLSGMPELKLGLNDSDKRPAGDSRPRKGKYINLEDVKFHQCVQLDVFEKDRTIAFTPPDGKFELMSYRVRETTARPLFVVSSNIDVRSHSRVIVTVRAKSQYRKRTTGTVEIAIPVPPDADSPRFKTDAGTVVYAPEKNAILWKMKGIPGGKEMAMKAELQLSTIDEDDQNTRAAVKQQPVTVKFEIPYLAVSGLQVRYLKVTEPRLRYQSLPWVRYLTNSGDYMIRQKS
ncbi:AP-1 complex subunit mu-1-I [Trichomonascus vanleenenianus]|uniref:AP-1 complex subunit mu n=1 Tax=Trichomonascus vanleenenianus TaxID=2268995 RepID=UPI003ECA9E53